MFTVNAVVSLIVKSITEFQNISCLRLISKIKFEEKELDEFQNISCLRLIVIFPSFIRL